MTTQSELRSGPLAGVRILEFRGVGPAPFACMLLADMGAEILQIAPPKIAEPPVAQAGDPLWRGRSVLQMDLKSPGAAGAVGAVLPHIDILIEGFRPGVMERLGLGPDDCLQRHAALVYGRITGWGQHGPWSALPGHDPNYLAITGALHSMGYADRPPLPPLNLVADMGGGALYLTTGVLAALLHARATGQGQVVDAAMVDGVNSMMSMIWGMRNNGWWQDTRGTNLLDGACPFGTTYETSDGRYMAVFPLEPKFYAVFLHKLGLASESLPEQYDVTGWPGLKERIAGIFRTRTRAEWMSIFEDAEACVTPILSMTEALEHPHNVARNAFVGGDRPIPAPAPRFTRTPNSYAPADPGAPADLLNRWGLSAAASAELCR